MATKIGDGIGMSFSANRLTGQNDKWQRSCKTIKEVFAGALSTMKSPDVIAAVEAGLDKIDASGNANGTIDEGPEWNAVRNALELCCKRGRPLYGKREKIKWAGADEIDRAFDAQAAALRILGR